MRNCEQLLGSLGLFAYRVGSLNKLNEALADYGPENCRGFPRVTIKERPKQETAIERQNINVASFSGTFVGVKSVCNILIKTAAKINFKAFMWLCC